LRRLTLLVRRLVVVLGTSPKRTRIAITIVAVGIAAGGIVPAGVAAKPRVRQDVAELTRAERNEFVAGLKKLKRVRSPYDRSLSWYDQLVDWHVYLSRCNPLDPLADELMVGHAGPIFLPWHRHHLWLLERALRSVTGKRIAVPYWDWTNPASTKAVFSRRFMGGDGNPEQDYAVTTGPFRKGRWHLNVKNEGVVSGPSSTSYITRRFGTMPGAPDLPSSAEVAAALDAPLYDIPPFDDSSDPRQSFRNALEGYGERPLTTTGCSPDGFMGTVPFGDARLHNQAHGWAGGMLPPSAKGARFGTLVANPASPNDPVFFLIHANVDRLWAEWQEVHGANTYRPVSGYEDNSLNDVMHPLEEAGGAPTPADVARIRKLGYRYADPVAGSVGPQDSAVAAASAVPAGMPFMCSVADT
jgi:tyrosinase